MRRGYLRGNSFCKRMEEGPLSSLRIPGGHSALPCPQSILLSHSIGQFTVQALCTQPILEMLLFITAGINFSPQTHRCKKYYFISIHQINWSSAPCHFWGKYSTSAILRVDILFSRIKCEFRELCGSQRKAEESPVPMISDEKLII